MKKITLVLMMVALLAPLAHASIDLNKVDITKLNSTQLMAYQDMVQLVQKDAVAVTEARKSALKRTVSPEKANEWILVGENLGKAVKGCIGELSDDIEKFSQSNTGHWVIGILAFKLIGEDCIELAEFTHELLKDLIRKAVGITLYIIGYTIMIIFFRKTMLPRRLVEKVEWKWGMRKITYVVNENETNTGRRYPTVDNRAGDANWAWGFFAIGAIYTIGVSLITFAF